MTTLLVKVKSAISTGTDLYLNFYFQVLMMNRDVTVTGGAPSGLPAAWGGLVVVVAHLAVLLLQNNHH